jgi:hypothetical protein
MELKFHPGEAKETFLLHLSCGKVLQYRSVTLIYESYVRHRLACERAPNQKKFSALTRNSWSNLISCCAGQVGNMLALFMLAINCPLLVGEEKIRRELYRFLLAMDESPNGGEKTFFL